MFGKRTCKLFYTRGKSFPDEYWKSARDKENPLPFGEGP
jgi:hypothetical protein